MHPTHPGRRPWPTVLLVVTALLLALFAVVLVAPPAGAHSLGGVEPGSAHVVIPEWTVKLRAGGHLIDVVGEVRRVPEPSPLPWLAGAALLSMAVVAAGRTRRWSEALVAALALVVALDLVQAAGAWAAAQTPLAGKLLSLGASAAGWVVAGLAIRQLRRHRVERGLFQLLLAAGLLTVVGGLGDLGFLFRSQLATTLPTWVVRAAVTAKIGLGLGALAAAGLRLPGAVDSREHTDQRLATFPLRGASQPQVAYTGAHAPLTDEPAEDEPVLATVLPWPGGRRLDSFDDLDDPDLPGGA
jgi:hypothetical protein